MEYDKEFEEWWNVYSHDLFCSDAQKRSAYYAWQAAREDHYRIGEEVENILTGERAEVKAVISFSDSITHIKPTNVRRIPAKPRIDEIAEEVGIEEGKKYGWSPAVIVSAIEIAKAAILKDREEREANR